MSALLVRPSPQPCNNVMHNIEFQPVCEFERLLSNTTEPTAKSSSHKEPSPRGTAMFKENTLSISALRLRRWGRSLWRRLPTKKTKTKKKQPNKKHFRCLQHPKMLRSVKEPLKTEPTSCFMHNVTLNNFHLH